MKTVFVLVNADRDFTPRSLMQLYARQNPAAVFRSGLWNAELVIDGKPYKYHHWQICDGYVALTLEEATA